MSRTSQPSQTNQAFIRPGGGIDGQPASIKQGLHNTHTYDIQHYIHTPYNTHTYDIQHYTPYNTHTYDIQHYTPTTYNTTYIPYNTTHKHAYDTTLHTHTHTIKHYTCLIL